MHIVIILFYYYSKENNKTDRKKKTVCNEYMPYLETNLNYVKLECSQELT